MKKIILMIAVFMSITYISKAQNDDEDPRGKIMFGLKAGANYSNVYDTKGDEFNSDAKFGFAAGAFLSIPIGKFLGIQPEILFSQKGFSATGVLLGNSYKFTRTTNYIDVPLLVVLKPISFISIVAGPQFSFLLKQTDKFDNTLFSNQQEQEFKNDNIRKNTLAFLGGIDINIKHVVIGARVGWDLYNNNGDGSSTTPRYKNVWTQLTIGYRIY